MNAPIAQVPIQRVCGPGRLDSIDDLAIEEPLEIRLDFYGPEGPEHQCMSITMRTPGRDDELAVGFLLTEGVIRGPGDIRDVRPYLPDAPRPGRANVVRVSLQDHVTVDLLRMERNFYTTSSCGVCGKASIEALRTQSPYRPFPEGSPPFIPADLLHRLPERLRAAQDIFEATGGLHASALFDAPGDLVLLRRMWDATTRWTRSSAGPFWMACCPCVTTCSSSAGGSASSLSRRHPWRACLSWPPSGPPPASRWNWPGRRTDPRGLPAREALQRVQRWLAHHLSLRSPHAEPTRTPSHRSSDAQDLGPPLCVRRPAGHLLGHEARPDRDGSNPGHERIAEGQPTRRFRLPGLRLAGPRRPARTGGILRERRQGRRRGGDHQAGDT